ncbi:UDP-N-acetylmuramoyl-L-alanyl-D-glutamate--2,6-diaminopimelate ligase [Allorhizobium sp. BGMRC 0089]|uniref:UDP-N-acetylmuramoyl-L-alanyl-D-glutamate--2, 6-diaminopimelate ligase n=1 Tax=Allorhizobium sonneratiae TaxID=2934936 RepID=UPI002033A5CC|nr:UDP-N-acetylmuramoyl-L-alanyl-D-glutamate--2,6-diaminopimelate ligase [Allorhizobium sonneratiae]MCM2294208.1 UDP-N-acetylmuramoyl-L-alanyl-D-glutamate--2,6-diaminopimelate ligase [Allorhizobium sonneratiae]
MKLRDLANGLVELADKPAALGDLVISGLTADSRKAGPGMLFFALSGVKADGASFVADAVARGASAVVAGQMLETDVPVLVVDNPRHVLSMMAARFYGAQPETMVAVTGTAGKTSVASFVRQIWAEAGFVSAQIGTTGVISPKRQGEGLLTTPDPVALHALLAELAAEGVTHAAMEASSHGLDQSRLDGVRLKAAAFTNLGRDHMDYHPTVEHYMAAKMRLFDTLLPKGAPAVIYADDEWSGEAIRVARAAGHDVLTVGRAGDFLTLKRVEHFRHHQMAEIHHQGSIYEVDLPLAGDFQIANALVAAGLVMATGVAAPVALKALERLKGAAGRLELVAQTKTGALAYVDYAHKPDALEKVLTAVRPFTSGRIITVFGCGGDRDRGKRPIMGEIADRLADIAIVTDDNPRSEVAADIRAEVMAGCPKGIEIGDRAQAIRAAVAMLATGDTLIVAGKGHEEGQKIGTVVLPFSDHIEIRKAMEEFHP